MSQHVSIFDLPLAADPEPGAPDEIVHGCDYDFDGASMSYYYNFLGYVWVLNGESITARAYLDDISCVSLFAPFERVAREPAFAPILGFLQRRFSYIQTFERSGDGYVLRYKLRDAPDRDA